jgi:hypothetical protein
MALEHPGERFAWTHDLDLQIDAFGLDTPVDEWPGTIIVPAGEGEFEFRHQCNLAPPEKSLNL